MKTFSKRFGFSTEEHFIQLDEMTDALRTSLWNFIYKNFSGFLIIELAQLAAEHHFKEPLDDVITTESHCQDRIKNRVFTLKWYEVYDLVEFCVIANQFLSQKYSILPSLDRFSTQLNQVLERERSGYRLIDGKLAPISSEEESKGVSDAISSATADEFSGARHHLRQAVSLLARKPNPDFRNSIKESISAVESAVTRISGIESGGVKAALREIEKRHRIHGGLREGFSKLYGYTSDEDGIRHAMLKQSEIGYPEAKYMLVACSAFVHYLIQKSKE